MGVDLDDKKLIVVRDRRKFNQFTIHNVLVDHWVPIIGQIGFLLYAFYTRLANKKDEKAFPGYTLIQRHLKLGRGSISEHNRLLVWCGLIHIEEGGRRKANEYYILAVPEVDAERIEVIRGLIAVDGERREIDRLALADKLEAEAKAFEDGASSQVEQLKRVKKLRTASQDAFWGTVLKRLDNWRPISDYWREPEDKIQVVKEGQLSLFAGSDDEQGGSGVEQAGSDDEQAGSGIEQIGSGVDQGVRGENCNNPKEQSKGTAKINKPNGTSPPPTDTSADSVPLPEHQNGSGGGGGGVQQVILNWMGFNGRLSQKDNAPSIELLLAWGLWVNLRGADDSNNPVGVARSKWRRGEFPELRLTGYAKGMVEKLAALPHDGIRPFLDEALAGFGRTALEDQIPVEYRDVIKR